MAYQTYITEAIVCGSFDSQTSDRSFLLFTREAGMLYAHAKSVREERSKHRYALQDASYVRVTLVRGKAGWRVTGAESVAYWYGEMHTREERAFLRDLVRLLRRIAHGEMSHSDVFDDIRYACDTKDFRTSTYAYDVMALRILHRLGYVAPHEVFNNLLHVPLDTYSPSTCTPEMSSTIRKTCEQALMMSHL